MVSCRVEGDSKEESRVGVDLRSELKAIVDFVLKESPVAAFLSFAFCYRCVLDCFEDISTTKQITSHKHASPQGY